MERFQEIYNKFLDAIPKDMDKFSKKPEYLELPALQPSDLIALCYMAGKIFKSESSLLELEAPVTVVGDIHGHINDLFYVLANFGLPAETTYLFLGDLVDRGEFSIECVSLVFILKIMFPSNVYLIRGNHEFQYQCSGSGFGDQLKDCYHDESLLQHFISVFNYLPLGALISKQYLCVHGGIGPNVKTKDSIAKVERPVSTYGNDVVDELTWSDPDSSLDFFKESRRGLGYFFGTNAVSEFNAKNGTSVIIRGHECVMDGFEEQCGGSVLTVFSASNYCGISENKASVLVVYDEMLYEPKIWDPLPYIMRKDATFVSLDGQKNILRRAVVLSRSSDMLSEFADIDDEKEKTKNKKDTIGKQPLIRIPVTKNIGRKSVIAAQISASRCHKIRRFSTYCQKVQPLPYVV